MTEQGSEHSFDSLGLDKHLLVALDALGFEAPTPVQADTIPRLLRGADMVARARTGSGKTAAFGLPLLQTIDRDKKVRGLVLAPTRELAQQVTQALRSFDPKCSIQAIYGGTAYEPQLRALRKGLSVVVGTPGRLLDLLDRGSLNLSHLQFVVLDEGDQMLQLGFLEDVQRIFDAAPDDRQTAIFSATMPKQIRALAEKYLADPDMVSIGGKGPSVDHIEQQWMSVPHRHKTDALFRMLESHRGVPTIVFARTRKSCAEVATELAKRGLGADALHGDLSQAARERVLTRLRAGQIDVLIATDVAARGLDVDRLELVINYDLPSDPDSYVHRIGRTGRAGRAGKAISFVAPKQGGFVRDVKRRFGVEMERLKVPSDADLVRGKRGALEAQLEAVRDDAEADFHAAEAVDRLLSSGEWTPEQIASAALHLLAAEKGVELGELPDDAPPDWVRQSKVSKGGKGWDRGSPRHDRSGPRPRPDQQAQLFIAVGRRHGVRPKDLVGALANETGIPGGRIGKITILDTKSFIGLDSGDLDKVLRARRSLEIRGRQAKMERAR